MNNMERIGAREPEDVVPANLAAEALQRLQQVRAPHTKEMLRELRKFVDLLGRYRLTFPAAAVEPFASLDHFLARLESEAPLDEAGLAVAHRELEWRLRRFLNLLGSAVLVR